MGLVDEIIGDAMDSMDVGNCGIVSELVLIVLLFQGEGIDAEADREVDRIVQEITAGVLAPAANAPAKAVPSRATAAPVEEQPAAEDTSTQDLLSRLQAL